MQETMPKNGNTQEPEADAAEAQRLSEEVLKATAQRYKEELGWCDPECVELVLALLRAQRMYRIAASRDMESLDLGVSMTGARFTLLLTLYFSRDNLLAQNEISRELSVSRTNITNLIDGLERDGLVARVPNPADRRVSYAQLTKAGEDLCVRLLPGVAHFMQDQLAGFSDAEKAQFKDFVYRLQRNIVATHPGKYARGLPIES
jgi:DNA-binding MarR family transcriptional regulator